MSTPGDSLHVLVRFFDRHFITAGTLNTTPHTELRLKRCTMVRIEVLSLR